MGQKDVINAINSQGDTTFKTVNNLLSLQENHVEEFFQYHGEAFLTAMEKLMEDVIERVVSQMLGKLAFNIDVERQQLCLMLCVNLKELPKKTLTWIFKESSVCS